MTCFVRRNLGWIWRLEKGTASRDLRSHRIPRRIHGCRLSCCCVNSSTGHGAYDCSAATAAAACR